MNKKYNPQHFATFVFNPRGADYFGTPQTRPQRAQECGGWKRCLETHLHSDDVLKWFGAWNATIQPKLDQLLVTSAEQREGWSGDNGLLLVMAGDSTIIQQFQVLSEIVHERKDFYPVQGPDATRLAVGSQRLLPCVCLFRCLFFLLLGVVMGRLRRASRVKKPYRRMIVAFVTNRRHIPVT